MCLIQCERERERERKREITKGGKVIIVREQVFFFIPTLWSFMNTGKNIEVKRRKHEKMESELKKCKRLFYYDVAVNRPTIIFIFSCVHKFIQSEARDASLQLILVFLFISRRAVYYGATMREKLWNDIIMIIIFS